MTDAASEYRARIGDGQRRWQHSLLTPPPVDAKLRAELNKAAMTMRPCAQQCGTCSTCVRASWLDRRGGDHPGGPVEWD